MSIKDKASDAAALALAGIIAITPVPAGSTANSVPDALNQTTPITEMASIKRSPMILPPGVELPADINPGQATQPAQQGIRYVDVTQRQDGWGVAIATAVQASRNNKVVIVSYLDPQNTRALYDAAVPFTQSPTNMPIVGLIRSPAAPADVTSTPNPQGFDVFYNGVMVPPVPQSDPRFTRTDELTIAMRVLHRNYFSRTATLNSDTRVAVNTGGGGKSSTGTGSAGGSAGGSTDVASVTFNPDF